jgi:hypothetical protein
MNKEEWQVSKEGNRYKGQSTNDNGNHLNERESKVVQYDNTPWYLMDHVERKVPNYENHKLRERKVKTLTRNWRDHRRKDWERRPCQSKYLDTVSVCLCVPVLLWSLQFQVRVYTFLSLNLWYLMDLYKISFRHMCKSTIYNPLKFKRYYLI